ncbi:hypothetical protein ACTFIW_008281 [Dictyostelium discoideum]
MKDYTKVSNYDIDQDNYNENGSGGYKKIKNGASSNNQQRILIEKEANDASLSIYTNKSRYITMILASFQMLLVSGMVFGWPALEYELEKQNVFKYLCKDGEELPCPSQASRLNLVYTIGAFTSTGSAFLTGAIYDRYGPRKTNFLSFLLLVLGCILWYCSYLYESNLYILSFALIGTGGPACQVSLLHISNLFPSTSSGITSLFSGMFVGSSIIFKVFSVIANKYSIEVSYIFLGYMVLLVPLFIPTWILLRNKPFIPINDFKILNNIPISDNNNNNSNNNNGNNDNGNNNNGNSEVSSIQNNQINPESLNLFSNVREQPVFTQIFSKEFFLLCFYMSFNSLHLVYYMGVVNDMFEDKQIYVDIFNYMWSGGVFFIPLVGWMMVKTSLHMNCFLVNVFALVFGVLSSINVDQVQLGTFVFASFTNVSLWSFYFIYLSDVFGNNNYGKLLGLSSVVVAVVGLLEYLFVYLNNFTFVTYSEINIGLTIVKVFCFVLVYFIWKENKNKYKLYSPIL